ncbi:MAG: PsbP-related protein [Candidatus Andersenbacteria bacterium]|nr:PsbP-related protein [bacterium]MDZ4225355.1 PsbP-related protein [Candidatus Andersenbacteria bacterium]
MNKQGGYVSAVAVLLLGAIVLGGGYYFYSHNGLSAIGLSRSVTYQNNKYGFEFTYPSSWKRVKVTYEKNAPGDEDIIYLTFDNAKDDFKVEIGELKPDMMTLDQIVAGTHIGNSPSSLISKDDIMLLGNMAVERVAKEEATDSNGIIQQGRQLLVDSVRAQKHYQITFTCPQKDFDKNVKEVRQVISSFRLLQ